jgi:Na+/melibiose symporter-like transporter
VTLAELLTVEVAVMLHSVVLMASDNIEAAGFILRGIKGIFVAIGSVIAAILCGAIAASKGRSALGWGLLGLIFSIITLIVVIVVPSKKS